jgi:hypothetical protein
MTSSPVYPTGKSLLFPESFLLSHTTKNYAWGLSLVDTPELSDESVVSSPGSELLEFQYPEEDIDDRPLPQELEALPLPLWLPDMEKVWPGYETAGRLIGSEGLKFDKRLSKTTKVDNQVTFGMTINDSPFIQSYNLPLGFFQHSSTDSDGYGCKTEPLDLEIGFECGSGGFGSGSGELAIASTILGVDANPTCITDQITLVDSISGDQRTETITNANVTGVTNGFDLRNDDDLSSHISSNHLNLSGWNIFVDLSVAKDDDLDGGGGDTDLLLMLHT